MRNQKGFAQFIIILTGVLVIILSIFFFAFKNGQMKLTALKKPTTISPTSLPVEVSTEEEDPTTDWKILINKFGWSIKYPPSWSSEGFHGNTAEEEVGPQIGGPNNCYQNGNSCGFIQIDSFGGMNYDKTPKEFLYDNLVPLNQRFVFLDEKELIIAEQSAYEITYMEKNVYGYANGQIAKHVAVKNQNKIYTITYYEYSSKGESMNNSFRTWQLTPIFDQILSTLRFNSGQ